MDYNKKSLVDKIAAKGVLTPYEAIYIQYLSKQYIDQQVPDIKTSGNIYEVIDNVPEMITENQLDQLLTFNTRQDGQLYDAYRWAAVLLSHLDANLGEIGYKGIALLNEIRYARNKNISRMLLDKDNLQADHDIFKFSVFSQVYQKNMTFSEIVESFGSTFRFLIMATDDILTLNYFLNSMRPAEDLRCVKYLKMWLAMEKPNQDGEAASRRNLPHICLEENLNFVIENNHPDYVAFVKNKLRSFGISPLENFQESSFRYVKETFANIAIQVK